MSIVRAEKLNKSYGSINVLSDISFSIEKGQKIALVGNNGTGKTTLLKIIDGLEEIDAGSINILKDISVGYLQQDMNLIGSETISEYIKRIAGQSYDIEHKTKLILAGFGIEDINLNHKISNLSSGQKSKVILSGILLKGVDLLLLDEPTNNLDLPALIWLENFINETDSACIVISHDRRFLDRVVKKIFEIDWRTHSLNMTTGTYSDYLETVFKRIKRQKEDYQNQQDEIKRLTERAREKKNESIIGAKWVSSDKDKQLQGFKRDQAGGSGRTAKVLEKRIEQMDKIEKPEEREDFKIKLHADKKHGSRDIRVIDLIAGYSEMNELGFKIGPVSFEIVYGNRTAIMGLNGSGKSTLLKTITGEISPLNGKVEVGSGLLIGNMMQEHETLPKDLTPLEFLTNRIYFDDEQKSYVQLAKFGFDERQMRMSIKSMSPGGRARLLLSLFSAQSVNFLVLDEPTNHLDIEALEALEEMLETYEGSVLIVSHDRYFLDKARLDSIYLLSDGKLTRVSDLEGYIENAEELANKLIRKI